MKTACYNFAVRMKEKFLSFFRRSSPFLPVAAADEFDKDDQKQIEQWLDLSAGHVGFQKYVKARDRILASAILIAPIDTEAERAAVRQYQGARNELSRLMRRAQQVTKKTVK